MSAWVVVHIAATWAMVGVIWTIQLLQYPQMARVPSDAFAAYEESHQRRVVGVLALFAPLEVVSAAAIAISVDEVPAWLSVGAGALLAAIWIATGAFYAPIHGRLAERWDAGLHARLVVTNWLRTIAWTVRGVAALVMVVVAAD